MKKFIFLFVAFFCVTISTFADSKNVTYTPWGNGLQLVTGEEQDCPMYGLRKNGIEVIPTRCKLIVFEELNVAVFYRTESSFLYGNLYIYAYDLSSGRRITSDKVSLRNNPPRLNWGTRYMDQYVAVEIQPRKIDENRAYAIHWIDKTNGGRIEKDLVIFGLVDDKLCKYVSVLKPKPI